jgi:hypothetical protein
VGTDQRNNGLDRRDGINGDEITFADPGVA